MIGSKIFLDTAPFIYILEDNAQYSAKLRAAVSRYYAENIALCTSLLTITEYCVIPYRQNEIQKITDFESFIFDASINILPLDKQVAKYASWLRATYCSIKAMDALQLATAIQNKCDVFLTNDKQLRQVDKIRVLLVDEL